MPKQPPPIGQEWKLHPGRGQVSGQGDTARWCPANSRAQAPAHHIPLLVGSKQRAQHSPQLLTAESSTFIHLFSKHLCPHVQGVGRTHAPGSNEGDSLFCGQLLTKGGNETQNLIKKEDLSIPSAGPEHLHTHPGQRPEHRALSFSRIL